MIRDPYTVTWRTVHDVIDRTPSRIHLPVLTGGNTVREVSLFTETQSVTKAVIYTCYLVTVDPELTPYLVKFNVLCLLLEDR